MQFKKFYNPQFSSYCPKTVVRLGLTRLGWIGYLVMLDQVRLVRLGQLGQISQVRLVRLNQLGQISQPFYGAKPPKAKSLVSLVKLGQVRGTKFEGGDPPSLKFGTLLGVRTPKILVRLVKLGQVGGTKFEGGGASPSLPQNWYPFRGRSPLKRLVRLVK